MIKLYQWKQDNGLTYAQIARMFPAPHPHYRTVYRWASGLLSPSKKAIHEIHRITNGEVTFHDWYSPQKESDA